MASLFVPTEILHNICCRLDAPAIKKFRLVNRTFAAVGLEYLTQSINLVIRRRSLDRVKAIATHSILKNKVRTIAVSPFMYDVSDDQGYVIDRNGNFIRGSSSAYPDTVNIMDELCSISREQQLIFGDEKFLRSLKALLLTFPRLEKVRILEFPTKELAPRNINHATTYSWDQIFLGYNFTNLDSFTFIAPQILGTVLSTFGSLPRNEYNTRRILSYRYVPFGLAKNDLPLWSAGLASLTGLHLTYPRCNMPEEDEYLDLYETHLQEIEERGALLHFLKAASNVDELVIKSLYFLESVLVFDHDFIWIHLKSLTLANINLNDEHILEFFRRHRATLKILFLEEVELCCEDEDYHQSFINLVERIKTESLLCLEDFSIHHPRKRHRLVLPGPDSWPAAYPNMIRPERALRYLMCDRKTNLRGQKDNISRHPYHWEAVTFDRIRADEETLTYAYLTQKAVERDRGEIGD
ncbi:hypothetical protein MMC10_004120 [Thelotrema lepadinum]|nr:hypothetical protein [Thelotrema lepadinum]